MKVGDIVEFKDTVFGVAVGTKAFVYHQYKAFGEEDGIGVSIITSEGKDIGGFSPEEQRRFLEFVRETDMDYEFKNVMQVDHDFRSGKFAGVFV